MSVAVPPMLEAMTSDIKNGNGSNSSSSAMNNVTGTKSSTVVTLSRMAERTGGDDGKEKEDQEGFAFCQLCRLYCQKLKQASFAQDVDDNHHPDEKEYNVIIYGKFLVIKGLVLTYDFQYQHQTRFNERNLCFVKLFRDN